eukprot:CAMPEP_0183455136 /NCGR_PEP_ID=MMETSP0370-20130417/125889_1 /TAXON_ID=268820 /ORGANISM="Peridinium aciculiferum, Strain PAER-2" /LENGTH=146 /DNA_ID=CAMNT_0025646705 /DNA_START=124 /DNA_END=560 /DNA_ORIENTATION=-
MPTWKRACRACSSSGSCSSDSSARSLAAAVPSAVSSSAFLRKYVGSARSGLGDGCRAFVGEPGCEAPRREVGESGGGSGRSGTTTRSARGPSSSTINAEFGPSSKPTTMPPRQTSSAPAPEPTGTQICTPTSSKAASAVSAIGHQA